MLSLTYFLLGSLAQSDVAALNELNTQDSLAERLSFAPDNRRRGMWAPSTSCEPSAISSISIDLNGNQISHKKEVASNCCITKTTKNEDTGRWKSKTGCGFEPEYPELDDWSSANNNNNDWVPIETHRESPNPPSRCVPKTTSSVATVNGETVSHKRELQSNCCVKKITTSMKTGAWKSRTACGFEPEWPVLGRWNTWGGGRRLLEEGGVSTENELPAPVEE